MSLNRQRIEDHFHKLIKTLTDCFQTKLEEGFFENCAKNPLSEDNLQSIAMDTILKFKTQILTSCLLEATQSANKPHQSDQKSTIHEDISTKNTTPQDRNIVQTHEKPQSMNDDNVQVQNFQNKLEENVQESNFQWEKHYEENQNSEQKDQNNLMNQSRQNYENIDQNTHLYYQQANQNFNTQIYQQQHENMQSIQVDQQQIQQSQIYYQNQLQYDQNQQYMYYQQQQQQPIIEPSSKKCKYFPNCKYMTNCRYRHPSKKQCWDFLYYECKNQDCQYLHSKFKMCINLTKNNYCKFMDNCRFYHPPYPIEGQQY